RALQATQRLLDHHTLVRARSRLRDLVAVGGRGSAVFSCRADGGGGKCCKRHLISSGRQRASHCPSTSTKDGAETAILAKPRPMLDRDIDSAATPQQPTVADTRQVKAVIRAVARELRRHGTPSFDVVSNACLERQPQSLWALLDAAVAASTAHRRDE